MLKRPILVKWVRNQPGNDKPSSRGASLEKREFCHTDFKKEMYLTVSVWSEAEVDEYQRLVEKEDKSWQPSWPLTSDESFHYFGTNGTIPTESEDAISERDWDQTRTSTRTLRISNAHHICGISNNRKPEGCGELKNPLTPCEKKKIPANLQLKSQSVVCLKYPFSLNQLITMLNNLPVKVAVMLLILRTGVKAAPTERGEQGPVYVWGKKGLQVETWNMYDCQILNLL